MSNLSELMKRYAELTTTEHLSVINTDSYDRRRFSKIKDNAKQLNELSSNEQIPLFGELVSDIWASFYKMSPELLDKGSIHQSLHHNHSFMDRVMNDEFFEKHHHHTQLNDMLSLFGTMEMGGKVIEWYEHQLENNEKMKEQMEQMQEMLQNMQNNADNDSSNDNDRSDSNESNSDDKNESSDELEQLMEEFSNTIDEALDDTSDILSNEMNDAMEQAKEMNDNLESLFGGHQSGTGDSELLKVPLDKRIELAELLKHNKKFQQIANWAGKFKKIARRKRKSNAIVGNKRGGITTGNELDRLLAKEYIEYHHNKEDFIDRFSKRKLNQYARKGKESMGKGSIIFVIDQSSSMSSLDAQSKGFALALMSVAKRQKRNFVYIPFSSKVGKVDKFLKGDVKPDEMIRIGSEFMNGGTDFKLPLKRVLDSVKEDKFKDADVIFVTDGEDFISENFIDMFNKEKKELKISLFSIVIGYNSDLKQVRSFSDNVIHVTSFDEEDAFKAFEI